MSADAAVLTHRRVLNIALPIVAANVTVPLLGVVDTGVVGQIGDPVPIGAVGIGSIVLTSIYWVFGFLRMGTVGLTAQARGAGDAAEVTALLSRALVIGLAAGVALILLQSPLFRAAFYVAPASPQVESLARDYMNIRILSAPAAVSIYAITGWMIAGERTRAVLALQFWINGVNIALDLAFVLGLGWGVEGVAAATVIGEWTGLALGLWLCRDWRSHPGWADRARIFDLARLRRMAQVNADILIRSVVLQAIFVSFLFLSAGLGDVVLAANQVLLQFVHVIAYGLDGFAFAAEALVGAALGAGDRPALRRGAILSSFWGVLTMVAMTAGFALGGAAAIDMMTSAEPVRAAARQFLPWLIATPLVGVACWMLDGVFIGATRTRDMRNMMLVSAIAYAAAAWLLLPALGNHGLWLAVMVSYVVRAVTLGMRYPAIETAADRARAARVTDRQPS